MSALDAINKRIEDLAENAQVDDLVKLGQAYSYTNYGAYGGNYTRSDTDVTEYHYITHPGEELPKPKAGFSNE